MDQEAGAHTWLGLPVCTACGGHAPDAHAAAAPTLPQQGRARERRLAVVVPPNLAQADRIWIYPASFPVEVPTSGSQKQGGHPSRRPPTERPPRQALGRGPPGGRTVGPRWAVGRGAAGPALFQPRASLGWRSWRRRGRRTRRRRRRRR
ncbi:unnamed protein product, partial [Prorocentrum cordatum]